MLMLTKNELKEIMNFFNLEFTPDSLKPLAGGDVNETYLAVDGRSRYAVKKIDLHQYKKNYNVSVEEIIESAIFCEAITKQLTSTEHAVSAIEGKQSCVLTIDKSIIMVYPYINGKPLEEDNNIFIPPSSSKETGYYQIKAKAVKDGSEETVTIWVTQ